MDKTPAQVAEVLVTTLAQNTAVKAVTPIRASGGRFAGFEILLANGQEFQIKIEEI